MEYKEIRDQIKSGDIVAFTHIGWKSWSDIEAQIVRMATRSEFSHVGVVWKIEGRVFLIEAVVPEVRIFPLSNFEEFYLLPTKFGVDEEYLLSRVGEKYSKIEAIKGYFSINKDNQYWQCAELVDSHLKKLNVPVCWRDTPTAVVRALMDIFDCPLTLVKNR